jgi:hypothetical protein
VKSDPKEIGRRPKIRGPSEKVNLTKRLAGVLRDIEDNQSWKYDELSPVQLLERLKLDKCLAGQRRTRTCRVLLESPGAFPPSGQLDCLASCGSWVAILANRCPGHRSASVANIRGSGQH